MTTDGKFWTAAIAVFVSLCLASCKPQLSCQLASGGDWFPVTAVSEVSEAAAVEPGSLKCGVVYHIDNRDYFLGGCNRDYVGLWAKAEGRLDAETPGRRHLICKK